MAASPEGPAERRSDRAPRVLLRLGFAARLGIAISLLIVAISIAHGWVVGQRDLQHLRKYLTERGRSIGSALARDAGPIIASGKLAHLYELAEQARAQNDVVYTRFFDHRGLLLASVGKPLGGSIPLRAASSAEPTGPIAIGTELWEFQIPISSGEQRVGTVAIGISLVSLEALRQRAFVTATLLTVLLTSLAVLAAILLARAITRPLTALATAADAIARGDYETQVDVRRTDEVGHLARSFNAMAQSLARSRATLEEYSRALEEKVHELQQVSRLKSDFLATVSHELRTPLNVILGYTEMLADGPLTSEQAAMLAAIRRYSELQLELITNVLDFTRLSSGAISFHVERFALQPLLEELVVLQDSRLTNARVDLMLSVDPALPTLETDRIKLQEVIRNLVDNAVKFTAAGTVSVTGHQARPGFVTIAVADTGVGIAAEDLPYVFDPFTQVGDGGTRGTTGVGLGLSIVKQLVDALGGTVSVSSRVGVGSKFSVEIPCCLRLGPVPEPDTVDAAAALDEVARNTARVEETSHAPPLAADDRTRI